MIQKKPRRVSVMDFEDMASEIHRIITGRKENRHAVQQIAEILGKSQQTVYDCLYGRIKINLDFVKAAVHATEDPDIKSFLEPEGWVLHKKPKLEEISSNFEKEVNDVYIAVSNLLRSMKTAIEDGHIDQQELAELKRLRVEIAKQADEVLLLAENLHNQ
jgi:hypothetical protein